ncbi:WD repeat-containing protein CG11141 [Uranotaenia lowii]|uniref:WD repeat-containing protein CG11141 n=1 Tax=Uranotaenia lowii TaxID=190385 RepID=UPI002479973B|nr:WD repeat-containing protein CG11141 [Uranotaenia lowii]XP_055594671.1 WD repeat-containing protein CG11141 [Uranotaenia lowii]
MELREWSPLVDLVNQIPSTVQRGLLFADVSITCLDVVDEFIALGTNVGIVFWYNRKTSAVERLLAEGSPYLTCVRIISTVEFMVAAGCRQGTINIFQIPKEAPPDVCVELLLRSKPTERYTVRGIHRSKVTDLIWSKNGMKLCSGDDSGLVVLTEINYQLRTCESREICNEKYEVVQLSLRKDKLLVSTTYRTVICTQEDSVKWRVTQVGKKDRKILSHFGTVFHEYQKELQVVTTRSGFRLWVADLEGDVAQTLVFKELIKNPVQEVPILNPSRHPIRIPTTFGKLYTFQEKCLISVANDMLFVLDLDQMKIIASLTRLRRILDISVNKHEILILESARSLVRISTLPDCSQTTILFKNVDLFTTIDSDSQIVQADECLEYGDSEQPGCSSKSGGSENEISLGSLDNTVDSVDGCQPKEENGLESQHHIIDHLKKLELFDTLNKMKYDDTILFKSGRKMKRKSRREEKTAVNSIVEIGQIPKEYGCSDEPDSVEKKLNN